MTTPNTIIADLQAENDALRLQQYELLSALEGVEKRCASTGFVGMDGQYIKVVRAAIASVKGGSV